MHPSQIELQNLKIGDVVANGRGGKSALFSVNGKSLRITIKNCTTPFDCSSYDKVSDRKSLDLRADNALSDFANYLDTELKKHASKIGCQESGYTSLLKQQKEGYAPLFPPKNNNHACRQEPLQVL